ncbi:sulfotransferase family protein [Phaeobacter gallaeciensis]|uniref:sulfotransferase family protein n=1 Tax=Phaeobacter gallaeciensis TaxID=60890 RepID=UPI00237F8386|nr:sulfotransferase family protein [Phaeobacter gallaeciensis]MDE4099387.1 sulfotransferase family protein [Phaeobacter gallaeciensis]MDE4108202.1 sulfotransferase family protein [Phaeobacter gallaeciensis]MDE4112646.1 sulfotransferase family protein [Phaeobacter gallaeciensis]MDE4117109.1 sulfotransferase family protein [Phaeobacter gallaeciensis]MDE4121560.1 sulfotransferase family protein [Phaeobacter gallaeciensis]
MSKKNAATKSRHAVVILGMHRSGTSALAGMLARLGCDLPEAIMPPNEFNPKGFYESLKAYNLNDAILASGGSSWDDWQAFNPGWYDSPRLEEFLERGAEALQEEYGKSRLFVLKDPRICRLMPFWTRLFAEQKLQPVYVLTHRNPIEVAHSLETREGWPQAVGLLLWLRHVLEAEAGSRGARRCFTSYDRLLDNWGGVAQTISARTKISFPRFTGRVGAEIGEFLSSNLRHSVEKIEAVSGNPMVSDWVRATFGIMERWAETGEDEADHAQLDEIRAAFDKAAPVFSPLFHALRSRGDRGAAALEKMTAEREAELRHAAEKYDELQGDLAARQQAFEALQGQKSETERANAQLTTQLEESAERLDALKQQLKETEEERWQIRSTLEQRSQEIEDMARQSAQAEARAEALTVQLERLSQEQAGLKSERDSLLSEQARLVAERDQSQKSARVMRSKLQEDFETRLRETLVAQRQLADDRSAGLSREIHDLEAALQAFRREAENRAEEMQRLSADRDLGIAEREAQAEILHQQQQRIAELEQMTEAYVNSTSWKVTAPLRRIVRTLRGQS